MLKRLLVCIGIAVLIIGQMSFAVPEKVNAETAGETLVVRVGYFGDDKDYRVKAEISKSEMESLNPQTNKYTNMTRVGTIMSTIAQGPTLKSVLNKAGIDIGSIRIIHLRTTDGDGGVNNWFLDFPASKYIGSSLYYYPNLVENWEKISDGKGLPKEGALKDGKTVDTIIAVKCFTTKSASESKNLTESKMTSKDCYRLCAGQVQLKEGVETTAISSHESAKYIYGIDITLWGSPGDATGLALNLKEKSIKVGSTKKITANVTGQELFQDKVDKKLKWSSSDEKIATVDKDGNIHVIKEGKVTITAKTKNGITKSIVINGTNDPSSSGNGEDPKNQKNPSGYAGENKSSKSGKIKKLSNIKAIEVSLGAKVSEGIEEVRPEMAEDAIALTEEEADQKVVLFAGCIALLIFATGIIVRTIRFKREV